MTMETKAREWVRLVHGEARPTFKNEFEQILAVVSATEESNPCLNIRTQHLSERQAIAFAIWILETFANGKIDGPQGTFQVAS